MQSAPLIVGVRHFSPACARLVVQRIAELRPRHVLIEGPADFNARLDELALPHRLPVAIYSYCSADDDALERRASWSPFALHSPEWQAMQAARACGARLRFIDLPAWHDAFAHIMNRYDDDAPDTAQAYEDALCRAMAIDGRDALWDHLFEGDLAADELSARLDAHFANLRAGDPGSPGNQAREAMMARHVAWAMHQDDGPVLVVCGGYHAPALAALWRTVPAADCGSEPSTPAPPDAPGLRYGSYLVPYHFKRLDAYDGYASGMSSPAWYEWAWTLGLAGAGKELLRTVLARLREKKLPASTADVIAIHSRAMGLARMRAHPAPLRSDWLDALAGSLVSQALDVPLPWTYRGRVRAGTDAALVEVMAVLAGDAVGELARGTPQPPLVAAVDAELAALGIVLPSRPAIDLLDPAQRPRSRALHRLALLDIPGIVRSDGPDLALGRGQHENWDLRAPLEQRAALIEAATYGATLHDAARARLEEILRQRPAGASRIGAISGALNRAAFAGLPDVSGRLLDELHDAIGQEPHFGELGMPMQVLFALYRHGDALGVSGSAVLQTAIAAAFDRALWLAEASGGVAALEQDAHIGTYSAIAMLLREARAAALPGIEPLRALAVCRRVAASADAAPVSRGAALGLLLASDDDPDGGTLASTLLASLPPALVGDALAGLLALARQHLCDDARFIRALDALVRTLDDADFVLALPAMRAAFTWLPTQERGALAGDVLKLHDAGHRSQRSLTGRLAVAPELLARHEALERAAIDRLATWGVAL
ncbi:DUF5682 family protein [Massilia atriviolacea]|uniref:DUF5682 family protein n=1 Tax=Massilia atriviolacea TaxID=2495579 RepID=UPI0018E08BB3|nr:DUF5682 family protein [Massilia atriviolacea]